MPVCVRCVFLLNNFGRTCNDAGIAVSENAKWHHEPDHNANERTVSRQNRCDGKAISPAKADIDTISRSRHLGARGAQSHRFAPHVWHIYFSFITEDVLFSLKNVTSWASASWRTFFSSSDIRSVYLSVYSFVCLFMLLSACLFACLPGWLSACLPVSLFVSLAVCLPVSLIVYLAVCLSLSFFVCLSVHLPAWLSAWFRARTWICLPACLLVCLAGCRSVCPKGILVLEL